MRRLLRAAVFGLVVAAVVTELRKPDEERTWHGRVGGMVPYDFRPPTWDKIRDAYWNPDSDELFSDRVFGVGWAVNMHRAKELLELVFDRLMGVAPMSIEMAPRQVELGGRPVSSDGPSSRPSV
jgi:hypothetical protein